MAAHLHPGAAQTRIYSQFTPMDGFEEAKLRLSNATAELSVLTMLLCDYQDGVQLDSTGLWLLLSHVEGEAKAALDELKTAMKSGVVQ